MTALLLTNVQLDTYSGIIAKRLVQAQPNGKTTRVASAWLWFDVCDRLIVLENAVCNSWIDTVVDVHCSFSEVAAVHNVNI